MNTSIDIPAARLSNLRTWNIVLAVLHLAQAVMILLLAGDFAITVTSNFPEGPPGTRLGTPASFFDLPVGPAVAVFLLLAARLVEQRTRAVASAQVTTFSSTTIDSMSRNRSGDW